MATPKRKLFKNLFATPRSKEKEPLEPWRDYKDLRDGWTQEYYKTMLTRIKANTTSVLKIEGVNSTTINIMMLGYLRSGKSSTINSIFCILDNRISKRTKSGNCGVSFTRTYNPYRGEKELDDIILFDVMGIEAGHNEGILTEEIKMCLDGNIEEFYQFNPRPKKRTDGKVFGKEIHCVMYCFEADILFNELIAKKIQEIESELKVTAQDRIVLVTKIDIICDETRQDIRRIFYSNNIKKVVEMAASIFRVPLNQVYPIRNYTDEVEIDEYLNIPLLLGLSKAVDFSIDYLLNKADQARRATHQQKEILETAETAEQKTEI